jgi:predicted aldo/keto reductase-like oxidoreductase
MTQKNSINRRNFLKNSALGIMGIGAGIGTGTGLQADVAKGGADQDEEKKTQPPKIKSYRTLGRTGFNVSDISSGGPMDEGILNALLDAGVNYIDTAESYGNGKSETVTGKIVKNRDRKAIFITTKLGLKKDDTKESILKRARKSLERMQTDYIDCLMMHGPPTVESLKNEHFHAAVKQLKNEGRLKFVGLSNHGSQWDDKVEPMEKVCLAAAADGRFDVMLFVYNFIQKEVGEQILKACNDKNIGTTLMKTNPIGGYLSAKSMMETMKKEGKEIPAYFPGILQKLKDKYDKAQDFVQKHNLKNPAEIRAAAIKYALNHPDVHAVCCSFRNFDDVESYIKLSGGVVTPAEKKKLAAYREGCADLYCRHACGLCESHCPHHVPVNTIMRYNHYFEAQGREKYAMQKYKNLIAAKKDANPCQNCTGYCQAACPHGVPIHGLLTLAHHQLTLA